MRRWTSGVTVVSVNHQGIEHGMTVSSFTSVSLDPPLITISLMKDSRTLELITGSNSFAITILSSDQTAVSTVFAGQIGDDEDRFAGFEIKRLASGSPVIKGWTRIFGLRSI